MRQINLYFYLPAAIAKITIGVDSGYVGFHKLQNVGNYLV